MEYIEMTRTDKLTITLTPNEINNLIYMFLRYTFKFDQPNNCDIVMVMSKVEDPTQEELIDKTLKFVVEKYGLGVVGTNYSGAKEHMKFVWDEFFKLPFYLRDDLGEDAESDDFVVMN